MKNKLNCTTLHNLLLLILLSTIGVQAQELNAPLVYRIINSNPNGGKGNLSRINALTLKEIDQIPFGDGGYTVEVTSNKKLAFITHFSTDFSSKGLAVVDLIRGSFKQELFSGKTITNIKLAPDGRLWVLLRDEQRIALINTETLQETKSILGVSNAEDIIFSTDKARAYVSLDTKIMVFDVNTTNIVGIINKLPFFPSSFPRIAELAISPDNSLLCLARKNSILVIDTLSLSVINTFNIDSKSRSGRLEVLFTAPNFLYISEIDGRNIYTLDLSSELNKPIKILATKVGEIQNIKASLDKRLIYVSDFLGRSVIDIEAQSFLLSGQDLVNPTDGYSLGIALAGDFSTGQAPSIATTSPSGSQQVMANQPLTIRWSATVAAQSYSIANHKIELSTDGGTTFNVIPKAEMLPADAREFTWQVPDIEVINKVQIRVSTTDLGARKVSSTTGNFSIIKPGSQMGDVQPPSVLFLSPMGNERFNTGDNLQISWTSDDNVSVTSQDLALSTDGGSTFPLTIASGLPGATQSFSFPIPMMLQTEQARLRLIVKDGAGNSAQAITLANFRIELGADTVVPTVTISQPTSNQNLIAGQPIQVKWQSTDDRAVVSQALLLSLDGGATFATIASFGASDNSFVINAVDQLNLTNSKAVVRITAIDSSGNIGQASNQFVIAPAILNATYQAKILTLSGIGFMSNSASSTTRLFVNEKEITLTPKSISNTSFTIKGNKKKLGGIVRGNNTVRLVIDGISSNTLMFTF